MRSILLCLLALVAVGAELEYREVVYRDGKARFGWWDPVTSILHSKDGRIWYNEQDKTKVAEVKPATVPPDDAAPTVRAFRPAPIAWCRLHKAGASVTTADGWLMVAGDQFTFQGPTDPFGMAGRWVPGEYRILKAGGQEPQRTAALMESALRMGIAAGLPANGQADTD